MNNSTKKENVFAFAALPAAVILSYVCSLCMLPSSGIFTCLPVPAVLTLIISFFCKKRNIIYISMLVMNVITPLLFGFGTQTCIISTGIALIQAFLVLLAKRAFITIKKVSDDGIISKSKAVLALSSVLLIAVWLVCQGNPISFGLAEKQNKATANQRYPEKLETGATFFDLAKFEYVTQINFDKADGGKRYYISSKNTDDYKSFHIEETLLDATDLFCAQTALPERNIKCYISSEEFLLGEKSANFPYVEYLIERDEKVTGMDGFKNLYNNLMVYAQQSENLVYKSITMTAKDMNGKSYYAYTQYGKDTVFSIENTELEKQLTKKYK